MGFVGLWRTPRPKVDDPCPADGEGVGDEAAVTAAPVELGAEDGEPLPLPGSPNEAFDGLSKGGGVGVVGIAAEGAVLPGGVAGRPGSRRAPTAEGLARPLVGDAEGRQRRGEAVAGEVR